MSLESINEDNKMSGTNGSKNYGDTILYYKAEYDDNELLYLYTLNCERIDKDDVSFEEIAYEVKRRQITSSISTVLRSKKLILGLMPKGLPRSTKVFTTEDPKTNMMSVFIDVTDLIRSSNGTYTLIKKDVTPFVGYLLCAMNSMIYHAKPQHFTGNSSIIKYSTNCFAKLFAYLIDYLRVGGIDNVREVVLYMAAIYYQVCMLGKDPNNDSVVSKAKQLSKITDRKIMEINYLIADVDDAYAKLDKFVEALNKALRIESLTLDAIVNKWLFLFGSGTLFGLELYEGLANMMIHAYVGDYQNNQNTIEKIIGSDMVEFVKTILRIGSEVI